MDELSSKQVVTEGEKVVAEELARSLEGRVLDQTRLLQRVNQEKEAALSEIATLREQMQDALSDARAAANRGTPRGEGAKKVLRMAFARIRDLNQRIDSIDKEVKHADERAETVQLAATSAMSELRESNAELTRKYRQLEQSLEKSESEHCAEVIINTSGR
jgi:DNA repair exonuclease SbcCD ATPase subunit